MHQILHAGDVGHTDIDPNGQQQLIGQLTCCVLLVVSLGLKASLLLYLTDILSKLGAIAPTLAVR